MDTHRINIFHAANGNGRIRTVAHDFKFDFLIAADTLFHQNLMDRAETESVGADFHQLFFIVCKTAAGAAQGKGRTQHNGIANLGSSFLGLF